MCRTVCCLLSLSLCLSEAGEPPAAEPPAPPRNDPVAHYGLAWTGDFVWDRVLPVTAVEGADWDARIRAGCARLAAEGGGVLYLPAGDYELSDHIRLPSGVVLRGAAPVATGTRNYRIGRPPAPVCDAHDRRFRPPTRLLFPRYRFAAEGEGTPIADAFKGILLAGREAGRQVGVVHLAIEHGHLRLGSRETLAADWHGERDTGRFLVFGCLLRNSAVAGTDVPREWQHPWQRWSDPRVGAITAFASADVLVANNRVPLSGDDDFIMPGYRVYSSIRARRKGEDPIAREVRFDYDNRSGVRVNAMPVLPQLAIWARHAEIQAAHAAGTVEGSLAPGSLATGIVVADNAIASTGRAAIKCGGRGTRILRNRIRFEPEVVRATTGGRWMDGHSNGNRAIEIRGWEWEIADNDYEVYSNRTPDGMKYNDGEGIMHEAWENVGIRDSRLTGNVGNAYLCVWRVPVRGLLVAGNRIRIDPGFHAIFVNGQARPASKRFIDLPVTEVSILGNTTQGSGIASVGQGTGNRIAGNRHVPLPGGPGLLVDEVGAERTDNRGYALSKKLER